MRSNVWRPAGMGRRLFMAVMIVGFASASATHAGLAHAGTPESTQFATDFARSNAALLRASQVAQKSSRDPQLREFSSRLAADAAEAETALSSACQRSGIKLPIPAADASGLPGETDNTFDRVYSSEMSQQLARAEALLTSASQSNDVDKELRRFAQQTLPQVRENRKRADAIARAQAGVRPDGTERTRR